MTYIPPEIDPDDYKKFQRSFTADDAADFEISLPESMWIEPASDLEIFSFVLDLHGMPDPMKGLLLRDFIHAALMRDPPFDNLSCTEYQRLMTRIRDTGDRPAPA